jgi:hypothetical protein
MNFQLSAFGSPQEVANPATVFRDPLSPTIYHEAWWLDLVTHGQYDVVEVREHGHVVGRLPLLEETRFHIRSCNMPAFTHFLGPAIDPGNGSPKNQFLRQNVIASEVIELLPKVASFRQKMHRGITDVIAFQSAKFDIAVQFTFEILPTDLDAIWKNMRGKTRNAIRSGEKAYSVDDSMDAESFVRFQSTNLRQLGTVENVDMELCQQLIERCLLRGRGRFWVARNEAGVAKAAIFCIWDHAVCYYFLSSRTLDSGNGAIPLLLWSAIKSAILSKKIFDFDGLSSQGCAMLYSGFGGKVAPRYIVSKTDPVYRFLRGVRRAMAPVYNPFC